MRYLIKIDRKSIKKNPDAGRQDYNFQGPTEGKIVVYKNKERIIEFKGFITSPPSFVKHGYDIEMHTKNDVRHIHSIEPEPDYLFKYLPKKIKCESCGKMFDHTKLKSESFDDTFSDSVCPYCGDMDCCDIEFEEIENVIKKVKVSK